MAETKPRTLFDKVWDAHVVERLPDGTCVLYIDRHLVHEVTSPQAFEGLRLAGRTPPSRSLTTTFPPPTVASASPRRTAASRWRRWKRTSPNSACRISRC